MTHQREQFLALMNSYDKALEYEQVALDSTGSATEKYSIYLESLEAAQNRVNASFEKFVYNESTVSTYTGILNFVNSLLEGFNSLGISIDKAGMFLGIFIAMQKSGAFEEKIQTISTLLSDIPNHVGNIRTSVSQAQKVFKDLRKENVSFKDAMHESVEEARRLSPEMLDSFSGIKTTLRAAGAEVLKIVKNVLSVQVAIYAVMGIISLITKKWTTVKDGIDKATEAYDNQTSRVEELESKIKELDSSWDPKTEDIKNESKAMKDLNLETAEYIKQLKQQYEIEKQQQEITGREKGIKQFSGRKTTYHNGFLGFGGNIEDMSAISTEFTKVTEDSMEKVKGYAEYASLGFAELKEGIKNSKDQLFQYNAAVEAGDYTSAFEAAKSGLNENTKALTQLYEEQSKLNTSTADGQRQYQEYATAIEVLNSIIAEQWQQVQKVNTELESQDDAFKETNEYKETASAIESLKNQMISLGYYIPNVTDVINDQETAIASLSDVYTALQQSTNLVKTAWSEMNSQGFLSLDTVLKMIEAGGEYLDMLDIENNMYVLKAGSAEKFYEIQKQNTINSLNQKKAEIQVERSKLASQIEIYKTTIQGAKETGIAQQSVSKIVIELMQNIANASVIIQKGLGGVFASFSNEVMGSLEKTKEAMDTITKLGGLENAEDQLKKYDDQINQIDKSINFIQSTTIDYGETLDGVGSAASKAADATSKLEKQTDKLQKKIDQANEKLDKMKENFDEMKKAYELFRDAVIDIIDEEIDALQEEQDAIKERGDAFKVVKDMVNEFYEDEIDKINEEIDAVEEQAEKELAVIDAKIEALENEKDAQDQLKEIEEARLEVEKAQMALDKLKGQKTQRVYKSGEGWSYEVDTEAIKEAEEELEEAQSSYDELLKTWNFDNIIVGLEQLQKAIEESRDKTVEALEDKIEQLEKEKKAWESTLDFENNEIKNHKDVLDWLAKYEKADYETRMQMMKDFNNKYKLEVIDANESAQSQIDKLEDLKEQWEKSLDIEEDITKYKGFVEGLEEFEKGSYEDRKNMLKKFTSQYQSEYQEQEEAIENLEKQIESMKDKLNDLKEAADDAKKSAQSLKEAVGDLDGDHSLKFDTNIDEVDDDIDKLVKKIAKLTQTGIDIIIDATTHVTGSKKKYATGGLGNFSDSKVISKSGQMGNDYVDGTPSYSELMLNSNDASKLWRWVQALPSPTLIPNGNFNNKGDTFNIQSLQITANNNSTFESLLKEARNLSINMKHK